jgi:hypothetical protein
VTASQSQAKWLADIRNFHRWHPYSYTVKCQSLRNLDVCLQVLPPSFDSIRTFRVRIKGMVY